MTNTSMPRIRLTRIYQLMAFIGMVLACSIALWVISGLFHHDISRTDFQLFPPVGLAVVCLACMFLGLAEKAKKKPDEE